MMIIVVMVMNPLLLMSIIVLPNTNCILRDIQTSYTKNTFYLTLTDNCCLLGREKER